MADRFEVQCHHVLRAVVDDALVVDLLQALRVDPAEVQVTLAERWLAASETIDVEEIAMVGIDAPTLLAALNPAEQTPAQWRGRQLSDSARDVLVRSLGICGAMGHRRTTSAHLLLALLASKDPIVVQTLAAHGLRTKDVRPLVRRWGRRAT